MRHFRIEFSLDEHNPREASLIWWLDQLKDPGLLVRCVLLGGGVPPWLANRSGGNEPVDLGEPPEEVWPDLAELDYGEDIVLDPEIIKEGLKKAFG